MKLSLHNIIAALSYVLTILGALRGFFTPTETATLLSVITGAAAAVEHARVSSGQ